MNLDRELDVVIVFARYNKKWLLCKHKLRSTWEIAGGHIEKNEKPEVAAIRELYEETAASPKKLHKVSEYVSKVGEKDIKGICFFAEISEINQMPNFEMKEIKLFKRFPKNTTYPDIYKKFLPLIKNFIKDR